MPFFSFITHTHASGKAHSQYARGFSLIELIVALGIFIIISSVLLFNYNKFNKRLSLDTLAHQMAQWVRDAQVSAMSVRRARTDVNKFPGYGLRFERTTPTQFTFFADLNNNRQYTVGGACGSALAECEKIIKILQGNRVEKLCASSPPGPPHAQGDCPAGSERIESADIVFTRPNPDANIIGEYLAGATTTYARANIFLISPHGYRRTIEIWTTGQVTVQ